MVGHAMTEGEWIVRLRTHPTGKEITMNNGQERVLGRMLAIEEISVVCGARPTSPSADTLIDVNGNGDTTVAQDSATKADNTVPLIDTTSPITD